MNKKMLTSTNSGGAKLTVINKSSYSAEIVKQNVERIKVNPNTTLMTTIGTSDLVTVTHHRDVWAFDYVNMRASIQPSTYYVTDLTKDAMIEIHNANGGGGDL